MGGRHHFCGILASIYAEEVFISVADANRFEFRRCEEFARHWVNRSSYRTCLGSLRPNETIQNFIVPFGICTWLRNYVSFALFGRVKTVLYNYARHEVCIYRIWFPLLVCPLAAS